MFLHYILHSFVNVNLSLLHEILIYSNTKAKKILYY